MKPDSLPDFVSGRHYRELHPIREGHRKWRYMTLQGVRLPINLNIRGIVVLHDAAGRIWGRIDRFGIYIEAGYCWNGCSPKRWVYPFGWLGTPDFPSTHLASLFHDFLYQFAHTEHFPFHRSDCDALFYHCVAMNGAQRLAGVYHSFVQKYGSWANRSDKGEFSTLL